MQYNRNALLEFRVRKFDPFKLLCNDTLSVDCFWNVMAHAQKPYFVFRRNGRVHLNRRGHQFSRLLAAEVCAPVVVMLDTPCSEVVWRVLTTHSIRQFPLHFPSRSSPYAITLQLYTTTPSTSNPKLIGLGLHVSLRGESSARVSSRCSLHVHILWCWNDIT